MAVTKRIPRWTYRLEATGDGATDEANLLAAVAQHGRVLIDSSASPMVLDSGNQILVNSAHIGSANAARARINLQNGTELFWGTYRSWATIDGASAACTIAADNRSMTTAEPISVGDLLFIIGDNKLDIHPHLGLVGENRPFEIVKAHAIVDGVIYFDRPLEDTYTLNTRVVNATQSLTVINGGGMSDLDFSGSSNGTASLEVGFSVYIADGWRCRNVILQNTGALNIYYCDDTLIEDIAILGQEDTNGIYGISSTASGRFRINGYRGQSTRHMFTTSGPSSGNNRWGTCPHHIIENFDWVMNEYQNDTVAGAGDTHAEGLGVTFRNGVIRFAGPHEYDPTEVTATFENGTDTWTPASNPFVNNMTVTLTTTGTLPAGYSAGTTYRVVQRTATTFKLSLTEGGAPVPGSNDGSGTHTVSIAWGTLSGIHGRSRKMRVENVKFIGDPAHTQKQVGVLLDGDIDTTISNCRFENLIVGVQVRNVGDDATLPAPTRATVEYCEFDNIRNDGVIFNSGTGHRAIGNRFRRCGASNSGWWASQRSAITVGDADSLGITDVTIQNNTIVNRAFVGTYENVGDDWTVPNHTFRNGDQVRVSSTGSVPTGYSTTTAYFAVNVSGNNLQLSTTRGGAAFNASSDGSGVLTLHDASLYAIHLHETLDETEVVIEDNRISGWIDGSMGLDWSKTNTVKILQKWAHKNNDRVRYLYLERTGATASYPGDLYKPIINDGDVYTDTVAGEGADIRGVLIGGNGSSVLVLATNTQVVRIPPSLMPAYDPQTESPDLYFDTSSGTPYTPTQPGDLGAGNGTVLRVQHYDSSDVYGEVTIP